MLGTVLHVDIVLILLTVLFLTSIGSNYLSLVIDCIDTVNDTSNNSTGIHTCYHSSLAILAKLDAKFQMHKMVPPS